MSLKREDAKKLTDSILAYSKAPECEVFVDVTHSGHTRFAANDVTTSGSARDLAISITSRGEGRSGTTRVNDTDTGALRRAVARSEEMMRAASVDPEFVAGLSAQQYPDIPAFHDETHQAGAAERGTGVASALKLARERKLNASGYSEVSSRWSAIANKKGNFGYHASTNASFSTTMRTEDGTGSGWAGREAPKFTQIPAGELAERAAKKAVDSAKPREIEPGRYTVILEPQAVADLIGNFGGALSLRAADEGRSFFSKPGGGTKVGEKVFHESVTMRSDPFDPRIPGRPWAGGGGGGFLGFGGFGGGGFTGLPVGKTTWVEKGVLKALTVDRYWGGKTGKEPLAFAGLVMEGGTGTLDDLIAGAQKALLVTRFWYIRVVNPQNIQLTGLTRDGVWLVENGKITGSVMNLRFNESPVTLLNNVEAMSAPVSTGEVIVPAIRSSAFLFTSKSDAV
jgi:predicted Zn-dependent protease